MATGIRCGYLRVSSVDQNTARQLEGIQVDKVFEDHCSGKDTNRPQLKLCLEFLREGDTLVVHSMDRLARSVKDLLDIVDKQTKRGVSIEFVKEKLTFTGEDSPTSRFMLTIIGAVAELERRLIRERADEGIAIAKAAGRYKGRKPSLNPAQVAELRRRAKGGEKKAALGREFGISRETVYAYLRNEKSVEASVAA